MTLKHNKVTLVGVAESVRIALRDLLIERPAAWLAQARERLRDLPKTNFDLGCAFAQQGKWLDALFRFRVAAYFQPEYPKLWYNIGCCYFRLNKQAQATTALQKELRQQPDHSEALFMLTAINPGAQPPNRRPSRMPASMVHDFFTAIAPIYDAQEARSQYQAGRIIHELLLPLLKTPAPVVLDLGCGTGIAARPWRLAAQEIVGVDTTPAMLALAAGAMHAEKKLFDRLIEADAAQLPPELADGSVDLVQLVNVAPFIGELSGIMRGAARVLRPEGLLALTIEPSDDAAGFGVTTGSGRFGHTVAYVTQAAAETGLTLLKDVPVRLYPAVAAQALVFSKGSK